MPINMMAEIARASQTRGLLSYPGVATGSSQENSAITRSSSDTSTASEPRSAPPASSVSSHVNREYEWTMLQCLLLLSLAASGAAWTMDASVEHLKGVREVVGPGYTLLLNTFMVGFAVLLTYTVSPIAAGSGIPEMKSVINGFDEDIDKFHSAPTLAFNFRWLCWSWSLPTCNPGPAFLSLRTLLAKVGLRLID